MTGLSATEAQQSRDAALALRLLAVDFVGLCGVVLSGPYGTEREACLNALMALKGPDAPIWRMPCTIADDRLLGGIDISATQNEGRTIIEPGLLSRANGGYVVMPSAERVTSSVAGHLCAALDDHAVRLERDGISARVPAQFALIALDESTADEPGCRDMLADRLAFHLTLEGLDTAPLAPEDSELGTIGKARAGLKHVVISDAAIDTLTTVAAALGIVSLRAPILAARAARASAALAGRTVVGDEDVSLAARLVLMPRAVRIPPSPEPPDNDSDQAQAERDDSQGDIKHAKSGQEDNQDEAGELTADQVLAAIRAILPPGLLAGNVRKARAQAVAGGPGAGARQNGTLHGLHIGNRSGRLRSNTRLDLVATLRAAAPWQTLRRNARRAATRKAGTPPQIEVWPSDFRIRRYEQRQASTTVFVVDASGSTALHRLAEAKGAVELLLADCYVRRDTVALIAFRGRAAELLLPPTRSVARAKRALADLAGGGATPLASGLLAAKQLVHRTVMLGRSAVCVVMSDGQPNIGADGRAGRRAAEADALAAARELSALGQVTVVIDTGPRPRPFCAVLATALAARYVPLPNGDAHALAKIARDANISKGSADHNG